MGENVEFWLTFRSMSYYSNYNRSIFIHTLFEGCVNCLFQGQPYLSRCELRLTIAHIPCKWRQVFLYVSFSPYGEDLQWIMQHSPGFFPFTLYCLLLLREWRESTYFFSIRQGETTH